MTPSRQQGREANHDKKTIRAKRERFQARESLPCKSPILETLDIFLRLIPVFLLKRGKESKFDNIAKQDLITKLEPRERQPPVRSSQENLAITVTFLSTILLLVVLYELLGPAKILPPPSKPQAAEVSQYTALQSLVQFFYAVVFLVGFGLTSLQIVNASKARREDEEWKSLDDVTSIFSAFSSDAGVVSLKRILESIDSQYRPVIAHEAMGKEEWVEINRQELRNGLTADSKRQEDGGFMVGRNVYDLNLTHFNAKSHTQRENSVAYCIDRSCIHLIGIKRILDHKPWVLEDFRSVTHYWINKLCATSQPAIVRTRFSDESLSPHLDRLFICSLLDLCGLSVQEKNDGAADHDVAGRTSLHEARERLRCHGLLLHYLVDYYATLDSDDVVMLLSRLAIKDSMLSLNHLELRNIWPKAMRDSEGGEWEKQLDNSFNEYRRVVALVLVDGDFKSDGTLFNAKERVSTEVAKFMLFTNLAYHALDNRKPQFSVYAKLVLICYWRSAFSLACGHKDDHGLKRFDEIIRDHFFWLLSSNSATSMKSSKGKMSAAVMATMKKIDELQ